MSEPGEQGVRSGDEESDVQSDTERFAREVILPLLKEYTEQLLQECSAYRDATLRAALISSRIVFILIFISSAGALISAFINKGSAESLSLWLNLLGVVVLSSLFFLVSRRLLSSTQPSANRVHHLSIEMLAFRAVRLEMLVRKASQIEDHGTSNWTLRTSLRDRLREARGALELAAKFMDEPGIDGAISRARQLTILPEDEPLFPLERNTRRSGSAP